MSEKIKNFSSFSLFESFDKNMSPSLLLKHNYKISENKKNV